MSDIAALKDRHRATWAAGDYPTMADETLTPVHYSVADAAEVGPGIDVLDVATGSGHVAILMAQRGASVTGLDLAAELIDAARERAERAGVEVDWTVGDAEDLPCPDESMDRVVSSIGIQFAPQHEKVAAELSRVVRPGGMILLANWTREGIIGKSFTLIAEYAPPLPEGAKGPPLWGDEDHVTALFEPYGIPLEFEERHMYMPFADGEEYVSFFEEKYGPTVMLKKALESDGRWKEFRKRYVKTVNEFKEDGAIRQDYYLIRGRRKRD